jgi:hypothetical protein
VVISVCVCAIRVGGRLKEGREAGKRGPWDNDIVCERTTGQGTDEAVPLGREGEGERAGHGADWWGSPISERGRAGARARAQATSWAEWAKSPRREGGWAFFLFLLFLNF